MSQTEFRKNLSLVVARNAISSRVCLQSHNNSAVLFVQNISLAW